MTCWAIVCATYNITNLSVVNGIKPFSVRNEVEAAISFWQSDFYISFIYECKTLTHIKNVFFKRDQAKNAEEI